MQQSQHEEVRTIEDGIFTINVTDSLRNRFKALEKRNDVKRVDEEGGGLSTNSQFEMYQLCKNADDILELLHYLGRERNVPVASKVNPRIRCYSEVTSRYARRIAEGQRRSAAAKKAHARKSELATV